MSKTFVLIVGDDTKSLRNGGCQYCGSYNSWTKSCAREYTIDYRSYIEYECDKAIEVYYDGKMNIVVLYNAAKVDKSKCTDNIKSVGTHAKMQKIENGKYYWNYESVKEAMGQ